MVQLIFDVDDKTLNDLKNLASETNSNCLELVDKFIQNGLKNQKRCDKMQNINISEEIRLGIIERSKEINCNPEKLVNSILFDYLRKTKDLSLTVDAERIGAMLEHDDPEGDDVLEKLYNLGETGWD